jgi:HK97 family phage major capsid protein
MANKIFFRAGVLEAISGTGSKAGRASLSFASEFPVLRKDKRGVYWEILSHGPGDAKLGLLNREGVVFQDHDDTQEIGTVVNKSARVCADHKTRAEIEVDEKSWQTRAKAEPDKIPVSVGYNRMSLLRVIPGADGIPERWYSWEPYEVSLLTGEPADPTVGLNRAAEDDDNAFSRSEPPTIATARGKRAVTHRCGRCEGTGRCACRADDDAKADKDCELCEGGGDCHECEGEGHFTSARSAGVDSIRDLDAADLNKKLTKTQREAMKILLKADPEDGGDNKAVLDAALKVEREKTTTELLKRFRDRKTEIEAIADAYIKNDGNRKMADGKLVRDKITKYANDAILSDESVDQFRNKCLTDIAGAKPMEPVYIDDCSDEGMQKRFSMMRGIQNCLENECKTPKPETLEGEVHTEYMRQVRAKASSGIGGGLGFTPEGGWMIPCHRRVSPDEFDLKRHHRRFGRDMQATVFPSGGATVPTLLQTPIIELLRNRMALSLLGVRPMGGLTGNVVIPRQDAAATAYSVSEIGQLTLSQQILGQIALNPKRVGATEQYSKQWLMQSSPDAEALVRDDLFKVIALKWDAYGLVGTGAGNQPLGMFNQPGIGVVTFGGAVTFANVVLMETGIRAANVDGPLAYLTTPTSKGRLKSIGENLVGSTTVVNGAQGAIWKPGDMVNGYDAVDSNQVPGNLMACGEWSQLLMATWGGLDVVIDYWSLAQNGEIRLTINTFGDVALRHPQAFVVSTDSAAQ